MTDKELMEKLLKEFTPAPVEYGYTEAEMREMWKCARANPVESEEVRALFETALKYKSEFETVAPDALYKRYCREDLFRAIEKYKAKKGGR